MPGRIADLQKASALSEQGGTPENSGEFPENSGSLQKGGFLVLADVAGPPKPERRYKSWNEGTKTSVPGPHKPK